MHMWVCVIRVVGPEQISELIGPCPPLLPYSCFKCAHRVHVTRKASRALGSPCEGKPRWFFALCLTASPAQLDAGAFVHAHTPSVDTCSRCRQLQ
eukprot:2828375-Prymnesium_polylepis.1